jgi:hypothetical protein
MSRTSIFVILAFLPYVVGGPMASGDDVCCRLAADHDATPCDLCAPEAAATESEHACCATPHATAKDACHHSPQGSPNCRCPVAGHMPCLTSPPESFFTSFAAYTHEEPILRPLSRTDGPLPPPPKRLA